MARKSIYPPSVTPGIPKLGDKPEGWIETTFGQVLQVVERKAQVHDDTEYQLVTARRNRGGIVPRARLVGRDILTKTQFFIKAGDFLISKRQIIHGACGVVPPQLDGALVSNEYAALRVKNGLLLEFLNYFCHTVYFQQTCFQSSVGVDVEKMIFNLGDWLNYNVHLPPLSEQMRIVDILSAWDRAIALTEQRITAARRRKKSLLQRLLAGRKRFGELVSKESFLADVDVASRTWHVAEFGTFVRRENRKFDPRKELDSRRCIELEHISQETGKILGSISTGNQKSVKNRFDSGQVLFGKLRPYLRKYAQPDFDGVCSSEIWVLSGNPSKCHNDYLFYLVQSDRFIGAASVTSGTKMPRSDWDYLSGTTFRLPPIREQHKIAPVLQACDREIDLLVQKLEVLQCQKRGLMQRLLTGRMRTKV